MAEVPQSAEWYVRSAIIKAVISNGNTIKDCRRMIEDQSLPGTVLQSLQGMLDHELQWRREAWEEFEKLPDDLRPNLDMMVREV